MVTTTLHTVEDLPSLLDSVRPWELWRGVLRPMTVTGGPHGSVICRLTAALGPHVYGRGLGELFCEATAFVLERAPDTVLCPDTAFVAKARLPEGGIGPGLLELAPDLSVEVLSPGDRPAEIRAKIAAYLRLGVRAVWVIDPQQRIVQIHAAGEREILLTERDDLEGGEVIPGFRCSVAALFAGLRA
ncbi:MAG TPA: Uma2 family endonuclease [Thermoanaerobaculia bacterium]|nr:Uma2 family endonuclease [Thermoanaerobaculia bacterium]